ncbi:MAG: hypothetical protein AB7O68_18605 [Pirellulales bacterium]
MRKLFRRLSPCMALGLLAAVGSASPAVAAAPGESGPALVSPTVEGALAGPRRTSRATVRSSTTPSRSKWTAAKTTESRYATADAPAEPAFSQAVANSWRRSSRATVRSTTRTPSRVQSSAAASNVASVATPTPVVDTTTGDEAPEPNNASDVAQVSATSDSTRGQSTTSQSAVDSAAMPALTGPNNEAASSQSHATVAATTASPAPAQSIASTRQALPAAATATKVEVAAGPAATSQPTTPRETIATTGTPLAERRALLGHPVARLRSAIQAGRADVQQATVASPDGSQTAAAGVQAAGFEGTVIRDVPLAEAESIPAPQSTMSPDASGLAAGTVSECSECGDGCVDDCCVECPRRRPLLALIDKLDECKAKCRACCNQESWNNCNCNGSYKFPVPPLYTYHWPGLYSAELMTDYHSPWRFPPLKRYTPEVPRAGEGPPQPLTMVVPTSHREQQGTSAAQPQSTVQSPNAAAKPRSATANSRPAPKVVPAADTAAIARPAAKMPPAATARIVGEAEPTSKKICRAYGIAE